MPTKYTLSTRSRIVISTVLLTVPVLTVTGLFAVTDDNLVPYENSALARQYTNTDLGENVQAEAKQFSPVYGQPGGTETLVLYDDEAADAASAEMYAIAAGNLATHFGMVEIKTIDEYQAGHLADVDAAIYLGTDHGTEVPDAFVADVLNNEGKVLWIDQNADALADEAFVSAYGWDPTETRPVASAEVEDLSYDGSALDRYIAEGDSETIDTPEVIDDEVVDLVATGQDRDGQEYPWVIRSKNLTYLTELPFHYVDQNDLYLIYADLYYDLLAPETEEIQQAAVRLEDVGPESDPQNLRDVADYLYSEGVPFQVAVVPVAVDRTPSDNWYGLSLLDSPDVVDALQYMQERGGTLIQHGTTHQYGASDNPYSGRAGEDYEFYAYGCSVTPTPPYEWQECEQDSWIRKKHPVAEDGVDDHRERLEHGREIMVEAGLGEPEMFETPHYSASVNAYVAMAETYDARYEQVEYYAGMISDGQFLPENSFAQVYPYTVHDIYGSTVYPENLQNPTEAAQNNHPARPPQQIIDGAEAHLAVTESTASFYFHPFLDRQYLEEIVDGLQDLGYEFVPVTELK